MYSWFKFDSKSKNSVFYTYFLCLNAQNYMIRTPILQHNNTQPINVINELFNVVNIFKHIDKIEYALKMGKNGPSKPKISLLLASYKYISKFSYIRCLNHNYLFNIYSNWMVWGINISEHYIETEYTQKMGKNSIMKPKLWLKEVINYCVIFGIFCTNFSNDDL